MFFLGSDKIVDFLELLILLLNCNPWIHFPHVGIKIIWIYVVETLIENTEHHVEFVCKIIKLDPGNSIPFQNCKR